MTNQSFYNYDVLRLKPLTDKVTQLTLHPQDRRICYNAGQYIEIHVPSGGQTPFSIANAPLGGHQIELHIRHTSDNMLTNELWDSIKRTGTIKISGPYGQCTLQNSSAPILMIAGGTGFAPMKSLIEQVLSEYNSRKTTLFWVARTNSDLYLDELPIHWAKHVSYFNYIPTLNGPASRLNSRSSSPHDILREEVLKHFSDVSSHHVYIAGPLDMVRGAYAILERVGLNENHCYSDNR